MVQPSPPGVIMDHGWVRDGQAWAWKDRYGQIVAEFSETFVRRCPDPVLAVAGRLPGPLPDFELVLMGGISDGVHLYCPGDLPMFLLVSVPVTVLYPPGSEPDEADPVPEPARYERQRQACGHGRACPFVYAPATVAVS